MAPMPSPCSSLPSSSEWLTHTHTSQFSPDGSKLASAGEDCHIVIWDLTNPKEREPTVVVAKSDARQNFEAKAHAAGALMGAMGGLSGGLSKGMGGLTRAISQKSRTESTPPPAEVEDFTKHEETITCLSWSPDNSFLASGSEDNSIRIWNFSKPEDIEVMVLQGHTNDVKDVAFSLDGNFLASVGGTSYNASGNEIRIWDMADEGLGDEEQVRT